MTYTASKTDPVPAILSAKGMLFHFTGFLLM